MRYFVLDLQGNRFGPADVPLLNEWATQGRIAPNTVLINENTGAQVLATQVPGLMLPMHPPGFAAPTGSSAAYPGTPFGMAPGRALDGSYEASVSFWCSGASLILCCVIPCVGILPAGAAVMYALAANRKGAPNGSIALVLAFGATAIQILAAFAGFSMLSGVLGR